MEEQLDTGDIPAEIATENDVKIEFPKSKNQAGLLKYHNPKLALLREAVLATLMVESSACGKPLVCLDASTGSGVASLQWKKHTANQVHVVTACTETEFVKVNAALTGIKCCDLLLDPSHVTGQWPVMDQNANEIFISPFHPNTVLRQEAFNFIFIHPTSSLALYTDSVFSNVRQNGVTCFLCPNIVSQCFRSPDLVLRQFGSHVQKTEYVKELAVRVVIAGIARAAARYQKGVEILYTLCMEDHFLIVTRVTKSHQCAVSAVQNCRQILHCRICEDRIVYPQTFAPVENPYSLLACNCKNTKPGKTAVILGPLWTGSIFSVSYLQQLLTQVRSNNEKSKLCSLLQTVLLEATCRSECVDSLTVSENTTNFDKKCEFCKSKTQNGSGEPSEKKLKLDNGSQEDKSPEDSSLSGSCKCKESGAKESNSEVISDDKEVHEDMPLFYYDLQKKKYSGFPKLDRLIIVVRAAGFRASRTHFDKQAIRTNANVQQLNDLMMKFVKK